jgi:hypothetical protein
LLLFWHLVTVDEVARHICDGPHIDSVDVSADTSMPSIYIQTGVNLAICRWSGPGSLPSSSTIALTPRAILVLATDFNCIVAFDLPPRDRVLTVAMALSHHPWLAS